jgi:hypothetical protein
MLRTASALGDGSSLLPFNVDYVEDLPHDLAMAISHGLSILNWQENLAKDEMPPEWMWIFGDELDKWFDQVKRDRESKYGKTPSQGETELRPGETGNALFEEMKKRK